jgi:hypothetical protein
LPNARVRARAQLVLRPKVETVPVSPTTIPDGVASTSAAATVPQPTTEFVYEVDSGKNWRATRDKLLVQLARMLASVRNYHPNDDAKVIGFYFPFRNKECAVQITLQWSDKDIRFVESRRYVKQHHVQSALREAYEQNHKLWEGKTPDLDAVSLNYPLSTRFLQTKGFEQIASGQSSVLLDQLNRKVYKYPLERAGHSRLSELVCKKVMGVFPLSGKIAFPLSLNDLGTSVCFFEFMMCTPPPSMEDAWNHIVFLLMEL